MAQRLLVDSHDLMLRMRRTYANAFYQDPAATLDDLREAVTTLEDAERIARRVYGRAHPDTAAIEGNLKGMRAAVRARDTPSTSG